MNRSFGKLPPPLMLQQAGRMTTMLVFLLTLLTLPRHVLAFKVGVITDVHAGKHLMRDYRNKQNPHNIVYPKRYNYYLKRTLAQIRAQAVELLVFNGDNTNTDKPKFAKNLLKMVAASRVETLWVRGNHDLKTGKYYLPSRNYYYFVDRGGWRIIVLDSNKDKPNGWGGVDDQQIDWLRETISGSEGSVIVFMHHPIFMITEDRPDEIYPGYGELERVLSESGKVKYVISGHTHSPYQFEKNLNGIQYYTNIPLTLKAHLGSYQIIDLP